MIPRMLLAATIGFAGLPGLAAAQMSGADIRETVSGNTVKGSMLSGGAYSEFYDEDGTIRGDGYTGAWSVTGNSMCFDYGEGPDCWQVGGTADEIEWIQDGVVGGTGSVRQGNPNDF